MPDVFQHLLQVAIRLQLGEGGWRKSFVPCEEHDDVGSGSDELVQLTRFHLDWMKKLVCSERCRMIAEVLDRRPFIST